MQITSQMVTAVELFLIVVIHLPNLSLEFLIALILLCIALHDTFLLAMHPLDVSNLFTLFLEVVLAFPEGLTQFIFLGE